MKCHRQGCGRQAEAGITLNEDTNYFCLPHYHFMANWRAGCATLHDKPGRCVAGSTKDGEEEIRRYQLSFHRYVVSGVSARCKDLRDAVRGCSRSHLQRGT